MKSKIIAAFKKFGLSNLVSVALVVFVLILKGPQILSNFMLQSKVSEPVNVERLSGEQISFPIPNQRQIVLFWFTTCGPCKIEMDKLDRMVSEGKVRAENIIAINSYEPKEVVSEFLKSKPYPFIFAMDSDGKLAEKFKVTSTPTILFFDIDGTLTWATSGLTPTLEFRVNRFLNPS